MDCPFLEGRTAEMKDNATLPCIDCIVFPRCVARTNIGNFVIYVLIHECSMLNKYLEEENSITPLLAANTSKKLLAYKREKIRKHFGLPGGILDTYYEKYGVGERI